VLSWSGWRHFEGPATASIQNVPSGLLISQDFSPRSVPNRHPQGALRTKRFFRTSVPTSMLVLADDAALARLVIAATDVAFGSKADI